VDEGIGGREDTGIGERQKQEAARGAGGSERSAPAAEKGIGGEGRCGAGGDIGRG
jgi:hypothetical protein